MKRLWSMLRSRRLDRELDEEIAAHLAMQEEEFRRSGMSEREAQASARREFGGVLRAKELYRERRGLPWLESVGKDLRLAIRGLRQNKGFAAAAILSLALGIGANTAIFTIFRALMLRNLPVSRPDELISLYRTGAWGRGLSSYPLYLEFKKRADLFQDVIARSPVDKALFSAGPGDREETVWREHVTGNYFGALGITPALGRLIGEEDNRTQHAHPVAVLSWDFWQRRFGGDPSALGRTVVWNDQTLTVIGVAQRGFRGVDVDRQTELWLPVMMRRGDVMAAGQHWASIVGRRRPGVSRQQIQAAAEVILKQHLEAVYGQHPNARFRKVAMAQQIEAREGATGLSGLRDQFGGPLRVLMAAVGLILLAACANVANLLLARGAARRKEAALRVSLGATRGRLVQQALIESFLLAAMGALSGLTLAYWGTGAILAFLPEPFAATPDEGVLAFAVALTALAAILFGLAPAVRAARIDPVEGLRITMGSPEPRSLTRRALVTAQVAFSVVLVALAGLFGHSMVELRSVDLGFKEQNAVAFAIDSPRRIDAGQRAVRRERLIERLERIPGVTAVSAAFPGPYLDGTSTSTLTISGIEVPAKEGWATSVHKVGPRYLETIGATLVAGRGIGRTDTADSRPVAVVNEALVRQYLPGDARVFDRLVNSRAVVGIVRDIAHNGVRAKPGPAIYIPLAQSEPGDFEPSIVARGTIPAEALIGSIRREFASLGLRLAGEPKPLRQRIDESVFQDRLLATLGGLFGILALALAAVGLYGVVAYGTARRAREIGIRIALGARRGEVVWMVLRDALALVAAGLMVGLPASYAAARQVSALLFGVEPLDQATFAMTAGVLGGIGVAAALLPARRAATLEPLAVLRQD